MKPEKLTVYQLFERQQRYIVPLFQRPYVWEKEQQWKPLWDDLTFKANQIIDRDSYERDIGAHFLGAAVINELKTFGKQVRKYEIIDGQQRLTTLQILLMAFRSFLKQIAFEDEALLGELARLTANGGSRSEEIEKYKVWPTTADRSTFEAIVVAASPQDLRRLDGQAGSQRLAQAYHFFYDSIDEYVRFGENDDEIISPEYAYDSDMARTRIDALMEALKRHLEIVIIELESSDDPQIIFETLNARGVPLFPSDLIRNFVFLEAANHKEDTERLYNNYWLMYDDYEHGAAGFWKEEEKQGRLSRPRIDLFMFHYLTLKTGQEIKITHLFQEFRRWWQHTRKQDEPVEHYLRDIARYSRAYHRLVTMEGQSRLGVFIRRLKAMDTGTLYPLLLYFYGERTDIPAVEMEGMLADLESYLVRRMICGLSAQNYNRNFLIVLRDLRRAENLDRTVLRDILSGFEGDAGRWPTDDDFQQSWLQSPIYRRLARARVRVVLEAVDLQLMTNKQERVHIDGELTIEHVFPQTPEHGVWPQLDNPDLIHTFGNLTLLTSALNASVSNGPFAAKCPEIAKQSSLRLNAFFQGFVGQDTWDAEHIVNRGQQLFETAIEVWPRPAQQTTIRLSPGQERAIVSLCDIADQNGIGAGFRSLRDAGLRNALYPRIEATSIMYAPQANKNRALFTVWATPRDDALKVYVATDAFPEFFAVNTDTAYSLLGAPGWRMMTDRDADEFSQALDNLFRPGDSAPQ
ncbi:MAG: DUF262 domain-containing protein [Anaerolineae bacterium]|nr:DUF262 domain-containing protein [Anaerolineae bacterium]